MEVIYPRAAGLDEHKKTVVACVITPEIQETCTFDTMTSGLLKLKEWLLECQVTHVAMESTGVYWKPTWNVLEESFNLFLVNAHHIKNVPGRKTDVKDAQWIVDLLRHGLIRGSFVPDRDQRELRELARYRRSLIEERSREVNRIQKVLEGANVKLSSVATDILGVSGRAMLEAMVNGVENAEVLADMAKGALRRKKASLEEALHGLMGEHQRMMLKIQLSHLDFIDQKIDELDDEVDHRLHHLEEAIKRLDGIPGIDRRNAEEILAEIGVDMTVFPDAAHLSSWAGLCPGNNESAGKRKGGKTRQGNRWFRSTLVRAARTAVRNDKNYFSALYRRIVGRRGDKRAIVAVANSMAATIHSMFSNDTVYQDLGSHYFDERDRERTIRRAIARIEGLGYKVNLQVAVA
jgi:transposase